MQADKTNY